MKKIPNFKYIVLAGMLALTLSGCGQSPVRNPFAIRQEPTLGALPPLDEAESTSKILWSQSILAKQQRFSKLSPAVTSQVIYAADHAGKVIALDHNGKKLWKNNTGHKYIAGPTVSENILFLATKDAKMVALDSKNGHALWEVKIPSEALAAPAAGEGIVLIHTMDGSVSALEANNGKLIWQFKHPTPALTLRYSSKPVITDNKALVGFSSGKLAALNLQTGLIEWERSVSLPHGRSELQRMVDISADPLVLEDKAYVVTYQGKLACVDIPSGNLVWEKEVSAYQNMALNQDTLFVTDNASQLWAINRQNGEVLWKQTALSDRYITGPTIAGKHVVVADRGGYLHVLSADKGLLENRVHLPGKIYQNPQTLRDNLLVSSHQGKLAVVSVQS